MSGTLLEISRSGSTTDPLISQITLARIINQALGGPFIAPWEVDDLPNDFIDTVLALEMDLPEMRKRLQTVEAKFADWRAKHPTYRKRN